MILPPPTSVVLVGISGFCGSVPLVVMTADGSPPPAAPLSPPPPQAVRPSAAVVTSDRAASSFRLLFNSTSVGVRYRLDRRIPRAGFTDADKPPAALPKCDQHRNSATSIEEDEQMLNISRLFDRDDPREPGGDLRNKDHDNHEGKFDEQIRHRTSDDVLDRQLRHH